MSDEKDRRSEVVKPPFTSRSQAVFFIAVAIFALILPKIIDQTGMITRRDSYEIMPEGLGAFSFVKNEIYDNNEDLDLLFVGSSVMFGGIDTPQVERALSRELGRPARVRTFGHYFNSFDIRYMQVRDLLERKRVRMVVLTVSRMPISDGPSAIAYRFIRYDENKDLIADLPLRYRASLYACTVLRSPHDLLTLLRRNRTKTSPWAVNLGADKSETGMVRDPRTFVRYVPPPPVLSADSLIYSPDTQDRFEFLNDRFPTYQNRYLEALFKMLKESGIPVMMVNIPQFTERQNTKVIERAMWSERFSMDVPIVGVPPSVLFAGLGEDEIEKLYYDPAHLNANGSEFFTRAILPGILEVYKHHAAKN